MTVTVKIQETKTHLSRLVEQAAKRNEFVIAKADRPMVRGIPTVASPVERVLGVLKGKGIVSADLKKDFAAEIDATFHGRR